MFDNKDFSLIILTEQQFPKENGNLDRKLFCNIINDHKHSFVII